MTLRPYQSDLIHRVRQAIANGARRVLMQSPTGSGKTAIMAHILKSAAEKSRRSWFVNHRREILNQSVETLRNSANIEVGIIAAGHPMNPFASSQVCSIDTVRRRLDRLPAPDLLVMDEAHHSPARTWRKVIEHFPKSVLIGLTATPLRVSGEGFTDLFDVLVQGPSTADLIGQGWLSDYILYRPSTVDVSSVHTQAGDYNPHELDEVLRRSTVTGDAVGTYLKRAHGKRAILFAWSIPASKDFVEAFRNAGVPAEHIDGSHTNEEREAAMLRFRRGETLILSNVDLFGEGLDVPAIEAVILCRPTQSLGLYLQQVGRGLRVFPGKDKALILDHAGNSFMHGLPDSPREWTLEGIGRVKKSDRSCPVRQCEKCFAVVPAANRACRYCGHIFELQYREVKVEAGELDEVDPKAARAAELFRERREARTLQELRELGRRKGYRAGWADHVYAARMRKSEAVRG